MTLYQTGSHTMAGEGRRRLAIPSMSFHKAGELGTFQQIASNSGAWGKKHRSEDEWVASLASINIVCRMLVINIVNSFVV